MDEVLNEFMDEFMNDFLLLSGEYLSNWFWFIRFINGFYSFYTNELFEFCPQTAALLYFRVYYYYWSYIYGIFSVLFMASAQLHSGPVQCRAAKRPTLSSLNSFKFHALPTKYCSM